MPPDQALRLLLSDCESIRFSDKTAAAAVNARLSPEERTQISGGKPLTKDNNYPKDGSPEGSIELLRERMVQAVQAAKDKDKEGLARDLLASARFPAPNTTLTKELIEHKLCRSIQPAERNDADAGRLADSPVFAEHPMFKARGTEPAAVTREEFAGYTGEQKLDAISRQNLQGMRDEIRQLKAEFQADAGLRTYLPAVEKTREAVAERYSGAIVAHASNRHIEGQLLCTRDRQDIQATCATLSGSREKMDKATNTAAMNTNHLDSHDFVFFNVYPKMGQELTNSMLNSTRYLKTDPGLARSAIAPDAQSFVMGLDALAKPGRVCAIALRDPAYPCGGTDDDQARARLAGGSQHFGRDGVSSVTSQSQCNFSRRFGAVEDRYNTSERVFSGKHIQEALAANVELGVLRAYKGLHQDQAAKPAPTTPDESPLYRFQKTVHTATTVGASETPEQTEQRDKAMLALIKLYQYPQLMVSGPVQLQDAQVHQPKGAVAWQDSQAAAQPEQQQEATRAVHARH
jgi:hypothetical protein